LRKPFVGSGVRCENCRSRLGDIGIAVTPHDCVVVVGGMFLGVAVEVTAKSHEKWRALIALAAVPDV
jgi:hypothetical protein